jgi:hypothetical protein
MVMARDEWEWMTMTGWPESNGPKAVSSWAGVEQVWRRGVAAWLVLLIHGGITNHPTQLRVGHQQFGMHERVLRKWTAFAA